MASDPNDPIIPRDADELHALHLQIEDALERGFQKLCEALVLTFGEEPAGAAVSALLVASADPNRRAAVAAEIGAVGWREVVSSAHNTLEPFDTTQQAQIWVDGAEYAGQGLAPSYVTSLEDRERLIQGLIQQSNAFLKNASMIVGDKFDYIWEGVAARGAIDFGGSVSLTGLRLLADLPLTAVRNAVSIGSLHPDADGKVTAEEARSWLARRREFCPSRWKNPSDMQWPFDPDRVVSRDPDGMILVPQAGDDDRFEPDRVVRQARRGTGISITIGAKGEEAQYDDFYDALKALAVMDVARWRRRNSVGNWGIVRARGAWASVPKAYIDRQLAALPAGEP